jgi:hypothetical protein
MKYLVLSARPYDFQDEKTGRRVKGTTVSYCSLDEVITDPEAAGGLRGVAVLKGPAAEGVNSQLSKLPGFYDCDIRLRMNGAGKPEATLASARFIADLDGEILASDVR